MKSTSYHKETERLRYDDGFNKFIKRYAPSRKAAVFVIIPLTAVACMALTGAHLFVNLNTFVHQAFIAVSISILLGGIVEIGKYYFGDGFFDGLRDEDYADPETKGAFYTVAFMYILLVSFSIYFDWMGAPIVADFIKSRQEPIETKLVDLNAINAQYDVKVTGINDRQKAALNTKWKGSVTRDAMRMSKQFETTKQTIEAQRMQALDDARAANATLLHQYEKESANSGFWLRGILTVFVLLQMFCMRYAAIYNESAKTQIGAHGHTPPSKKQQVDDEQEEEDEAQQSQGFGAPMVDLDALANVLAKKLGLNTANLSMMQKPTGTTAENQTQPPTLVNEIGFRGIKNLHQQMAGTQTAASPTPSNYSPTIAPVATDDEAFQPVSTSFNQKKQEARQLDIATYDQAWKKVFGLYQAWCNKWKLNPQIDTTKMWACYKELYTYLNKLRELGVDVMPYETRIDAYGNAWMEARPANIRNVPRVGQHFKDRNGLVLECVRYALKDLDNVFGKESYDHVATQPHDDIFIIAREPGTEGEGFVPLDLVAECLLETVQE